MYSIGEAAKATGISAYTLRYYEKIGLLQSPERREGGVREYSEGDVRLIRFLGSLKKTGMSLEDIAEFVKDGCILEKLEEGGDVSPAAGKRLAILEKHLGRMEAQLRELESIIVLTREKMGVYRSMLAAEAEGEDAK